MAQFENKSFSVSMKSGAAPDDLDERWRKTFGEERVKAPAVSAPAPWLVSIADVYALLDKEAAKSRDNGDLDSAELIDLLRAKMKALEPASRP